MKKMNVALIYGGKSPEHEVSCDSAASIAAELVSGGHNLQPVYISREGTWICQKINDIGTKKGVEVFPSLADSCFYDVAHDILIRPDVIFPIILKTIIK